MSGRGWRHIGAGAAGLALAAALGVLALYASRFWPFRLWGRDGLFGAEWLVAGGDLVGRQFRMLLRGSGFGPLGALDLLLWAFALFAVLSLLSWAGARVSRGRSPKD